MLSLWTHRSQGFPTAHPSRKESLWSICTGALVHRAVHSNVTPKNEQNLKLFKLKVICIYHTYTQIFSSQALSGPMHVRPLEGFFFALHHRLDFYLRLSVDPWVVCGTVESKNSSLWAFIWAFQLTLLERPTSHSPHLDQNSHRISGFQLLVYAGALMRFVHAAFRDVEGTIDQH